MWPEITIALLMFTSYEYTLIAVEFYDQQRHLQDIVLANQEHPVEAKDLTYKIYHIWP